MPWRKPKYKVGDFVAKQISPFFMVLQIIRIHSKTYEVVICGEDSSSNDYQTLDIWYIDDTYQPHQPLTTEFANLVAKYYNGT